MSAPGPSSVADVTVRDVVRRMPGGRLVLDGITAAFQAGSVTAVVAANGVGKSTLARVLAGVDRPDAGAVTRPSRAVYLLPERVPVLPCCSARTVTAALVPALARGADRSECLTRLEEGLDALGSTHPGSTPLHRLSKGNVQKAYLAVAYALRPAVVVLDEPTTGLDPASAGAAGQLARQLAGHGGVVVVTAHQAVLRRQAAGSRRWPATAARVGGAGAGVLGRPRGRLGDGTTGGRATSVRRTAWSA